MWCVYECARARGGGARDHTAPSAPIARPACLRPLLALPLARGPGFGISCLFNERKEQKAGGEGAAGGGGGGGGRGGESARLRMLREGH